jgi:hypothetical protein
MGEQVTVEGRIAATHTSPLMTILSFEKNFNRFTAVIQPADRDAFPAAPEEYYRGKWVRISGKVDEYGQKPQIALASPAQIQVVQPPGPPAGPGGAADLGDVGTELLRRLTVIEDSLQLIADRLDLLLAALSDTPPPAPPPRESTVRLLPGRIPRRAAPPRPAHEALRTVKRGMPAADVVGLAGEPIFVDVSVDGAETWYYGAGQSISFNTRGRVEAMVGFNRR